MNRLIGKKALSLFMAMVLMLALFSGCVEEEANGDLQGTIFDVDILRVQNGYPNGIPDITYKQAYENFFANPQWRCFEAESGEKVVEFSGECTYQEEEATVYIQFVVEEETFYIHYAKITVGEESFDADASMKLELVYAPFNLYAQEKLGKELGEDIQNAFMESLEPEKTLVGSFVQVGVYNHDAYSYLDDELVPTVYLYSDDTFVFECNFYSYMHTYEGTWSVVEDEALAEYRFMITNEPSLPNLEFYIYHNKARCDAEFYSDWNMEDESLFGMTGTEDVLFHVNF